MEPEILFPEIAPRDSLPRTLPKEFPRQKISKPKRRKIQRKRMRETVSLGFNSGKIVFEEFGFSTHDRRMTSDCQAVACLVGGDAIDGLSLSASQVVQPLRNRRMESADFATASSMDMKVLDDLAVALEVEDDSVAVVSSTAAQVEQPRKKQKGLIGGFLYC